MRVLIKILSNALGDTICALPYIEKYRQLHEVEVYVKLNPRFNFMFEKTYPKLKFTDTEKGFNQIIPIDYVFSKNIQEGFANHLGFDNYEYIRPKVSIQPKERPIKGKYVVVSVHSTSQLKYWNHPEGKLVQSLAPNWNQLFAKLRKKGYIPVVVERDELFGVNPNLNGIPKKANAKIGESLESTINYIQHAEFFIGLSSGLTWLAHALNKKVVMISNFTEDWHEIPLHYPDYKRITNKSVCHGCFNRVGIEYEFDFNDWYWCPKHKDTPRQFECHTSITPDMVIEQINDWLK